MRQPSFFGFFSFMAVASILAGWVFFRGIQNSNRVGSTPLVKPLVVSTIAPLEALVCALAGDCVQSVSLIPGNLDPHSYQLRKGDGDLFLLADLVVYNGLGLEHGSSLFNSLHQSPTSFSIGTCLLEQDENFVIHANGVTDPHIWLDLSLMAKVVSPLAERLSKIFTEDDKKKLIFLRAKKIEERFLNADKMARALIDEVPIEKRYLISAHSAFRYFVRSYFGTSQERQNGLWEKRYASPEGLAPESQVSFSTLKEVFEFMLNHQINVLFQEVNVPSRALSRLVSMASQHGYKTRLATRPLYSDSFPDFSKMADPLDGYLEIVVDNARIFRDEIMEGT
ncbi:metal ABC transporter substrate-binding protein [Candidatus Similichlamydia epinepheli]|uniref:metal ABC transporter substrate-binding protein n=1 Tax=Candidatus Similichlamydia epinepheli TaxID=1903953 RepID=UPI000D341406|nr:metal ABC transporter substrate-binding protein [Candidatus Similichlamydia epinepheli]